MLPEVGRRQKLFVDSKKTQYGLQRYQRWVEEPACKMVDFLMSTVNLFYQQKDDWKTVAKHKRGIFVFASSFRRSCRGGVRNLMRYINHMNDFEPYEPMLECGRQVMCTCV